MKAFAPILIVSGLALCLVGLAAWAGLLSWIGKLPGDMRYEGESTRIYFPVVSMIVLSLVLTVLVNLIGRFLK